MANYLYDDLSDPSETEYYEDTGYTHDNKDRYWFRGKADQDFGPSWTSRLDLDIVSDRDYLREFNTGLTGFMNSNDQYLDTFGRSLENKTDDQRTNRFSLQRSWGATSLEAKLLGINDVRSDDAKFDDEGNELPTPLWNLPVIDYTGTVPFENLWDMTLQWDTDYANFWREEGIGGHRFDLYPTLSAPLPISPYLESRAEVGVRDTYYIVQEYGDAQWDESDSQNRLLFDVKAELGTTLMRTFAMSGKSMTGLTHQVRPYVEYDYLPDVDQDDLPSFDGVDRVAEQNQFAYGIDNFFNALSSDNIDRDYGWFKIRQDYSFIDARSDEPFSDINLDLKWIPVQFLEFWYKTDYDVYDNIFALHDLEGTYRTRRGDFFKLEYYFKDNGELNDTNQINGVIDAALFSSLRARFSIEHSIANEETNEANLALLYQALCWSVELGSQYTPEETKFMLIFSLANLGSPLKFYY
jgi:LPS-assembly protein